MTDYTNDISRYLSGEMTAEEKHALEKKALHDPFLADALEGAEQLSAHEFEKDLNELKERIQLVSPATSVRTTSVWTWSLRIAAGLLLISVSAYLIWNLTGKEEPDTLAMEQPQLSTLPNEDTIRAETTEGTIGGERQPEVGSEQKPSAPLQTDRSLRTDQPAKETMKDESIPVIQQEADLAVASKPTEVPVSIEVEPEELAEKEAVPLAKQAATETADDKKQKVASRVAGASAAVQRVISGKVTSQDDGAPIPGVNVIIKGTSVGAVTDASGNYQVQTTTENPTLVFSFIGFQNKEEPVGSRNEVDVQLGADVASLSEVVVVGYGVSGEDRLVPVVELAHPETGNRAFRQYLEQNVRYPEQAQRDKVQGRVTVEFTIEVNGALTEFNLIRGIGAGCDEELVRLIREGPRWIPTHKNGTPVRDKARVRLKFDLPK